MKKLMLLMLVAGFASMPAYAKKDEAPGTCDKVVNEIKKKLEEKRASNDPAPVSDPAAVPAK